MAFSRDDRRGGAVGRLLLGQQVAHVERTVAGLRRRRSPISALLRPYTTRAALRSGASGCSGAGGRRSRMPGQSAVSKPPAAIRRIVVGLDDHL